VIHDATQSYFQKQNDVLTRHNITTAASTFITGTDIVYEPQWFWPDGTRAIHRHMLREVDLKPIKGQIQNRAAYQEVTRMMGELAAIYCDLGAVHQQLGRFYPYREALDDTNWVLLEGLKKMIDPSGIMNPGALGLGN